jgi:segregation and condensation protein B
MSGLDNKIKMIVEGLLLAAGKPLNLETISGVFSEEERPDKSELREVLKVIAEECGDRGFELKEVASGYRFQVKQELSEWIGKLWEERPPRYSRALLETLALIAYRQPITRGDIEQIRGVAVSPNIVRTLLDREWVRVVGYKDVPGRPAMFATTRQFLDYFNLKSLQELPALSDLKELGKNKEEFDLEDDMDNMRTLDLPGEDSDENSLDQDLEYIDEEEAVALSRKPLDDILGITNEAAEEQELNDSGQKESLSMQDQSEDTMPNDEDLDSQSAASN